MKDMIFYQKALSNAKILRHPDYSLEWIKSGGHKGNIQDITTHFSHQGKKIVYNHKIDNNTGKVVASDHPGFQKNWPSKIRESTVPNAKLDYDYVSAKGTKETNKRMNKKHPVSAKPTAQAMNEEMARVLFESILSSKSRSSGTSGVMKSLNQRQKQDSIAFKMKQAKDKMQTRLNLMQQKARKTNG